MDRVILAVGNGSLDKALQNLGYNIYDATDVMSEKDGNYFVRGGYIVIVKDDETSAIIECGSLTGTNFLQSGMSYNEILDKIKEKNIVYHKANIDGEDKFLVICESE